MARNILFSLFLTLLIAFSNEKSLELETAEMIEKLQIENQFLRNQLRDVESDIVEIQKILKGHGNDITDIRIVQGAHTEVKITKRHSSKVLVLA
jgi:proline dehydrogenase